MATPHEDAGADVLLDVVFEDGLLYLVLANVGERPALKVTCRFERPFTGLGGGVDVSRLRLFRNVEFLAPGREIRTLLDSSAAYFARREPTRLAVTVGWRDDRGRHERPIVHDLAIYRDVAYVTSAGSGSTEQGDGSGRRRT
jgi:hypothetical protein